MNIQQAIAAYIYLSNQYKRTDAEERMLREAWKIVCTEAGDAIKEKGRLSPPDARDLMQDDQ